MNWRILVPAGFAAYFLFGMAQLVEAADDSVKTAANFKQHCASCHGEDRLGGLGPALLPDNLARLRKPEAESVIREGRLASQMQGFGHLLSAEEVKALVEYVYTPIKPMPVWGEAEIKASHIINFAPGSLPDKPQFSADPEGWTPNDAFYAAYCAHFNITATSRNLHVYPDGVQTFLGLKGKALAPGDEG